MFDDTTIKRHLLDSYGLTKVSLTRLGGADNLNYRVDGGGEACVLHLYTSLGRDRNTIRSELLWLDRLQADTQLTLPQPIPALNGQLVTDLTAPGGEVLCTLMRWVAGKVPPLVTHMTDAQLAAVGAVMAQLHAHARAFALPEGFRRETYDLPLFQRRLRVLLRAFEGAGLEEAALEGFKADAKLVLEGFSQLEPGPESFGLIHADFHSGNYLIHENEVRIIDFGRCGFGFFAFDLALALMELEELKRSVVLQGYETVAPLPEGSSNDLFLCLAYLDNLGFLAERPEEVPFVVGELPLVAEVFGKAAKLVR